MSYNLLVETPDTSDFEYVLEEKNLKDGKDPTLFIEGPYLMAGDVNRNGRVYDAKEMDIEVKRYIDSMVDKSRAMGELNHPTSAEVDLERACHIVVELYQKDDPNIWFGKSKVLSTPCGKIVQSLIHDGVKVGVSSRSLGQLEKRNDGVNQVKDMRLVAIDCVADPSYTDAFVDGILESKTWVCENGKFVEVYEGLEQSLDTLPKKDVSDYLSHQIQDFINKIKNNT
jgi:hypothetical protein